MYFVRHGESVSNAAGIYTGQLDVPLNDTGKAQAHKVAEAILSNGTIINEIISSPLIRAYETAQIIAKGIGLSQDAVKTDARLLERHFGSMEGSPKITTAELTDALLLSVGGETNQQVRNRIDSFVEDLGVDDERHLLLVGHNGSGKQLIGRFSGKAASESFYDAPTLPNAQLIELPGDMAR